MIRCEQVGLRYGEGPEILRQVSFALPRGSFHFLTGHSGAGKTSLFRLLSLTRQPTAGRLVMFGQDTGRLDRDRRADLRRRIGMVFQDFRLLPHLNVWDNIALPMRIGGAPEDQIRRHVREMLEWIDLERYAAAPPAILSGGQQQRVAIARAVIRNPEMILADEPTGNLDPELSYRFMKLFAALHESGTTILIATHDEHLIQRFSFPVLKMQNGHLRRRLKGDPDV